MPELNTKALIKLLSESNRDKEDSDTDDLIQALLESKKTRATVSQLQQQFDLYNVDHQFKEGDIVQWKPGLRDRKIPLDDEPAIVVRILEQPVFDDGMDAGSPYFREPYNIVLGVIQHDGQFITYHYNSRRFEPFPVKS